LFLTEQEITGDVLLELDVNLLKTEIGIAAFGKRMRIAYAISELRRSPFISYSSQSASPHWEHSNLHSISPNNESLGSLYLHDQSGEREDDADGEENAVQHSIASRIDSIHGTMAESTFSFSSRTTMSAGIGNMLGLRANPSPRSSIASQF